ncbi:ABC transporter substrate-binding protein [Aerococcaceae bacterium zg-ZJ1578]|uniref:ABC transporter substrate-binding protein n=1 Tax=Aerococcaceae TaxID=186827 RepID=UPI0013B73A3C|nr:MULTISPECIES: ABC transporter substrate-binding protein [unclassified Facklamia]MBK0348388.1 ABC transporter substrate-binding protein [Aerococcaceae bacterium zg-1578]MBR7927174.1 ABC transporter substrate-binding protein [Aerococcaceae bacterium zg-ZUI334]MBS4462562.1 ABC transporter substrate-binding protein [Aerococcaceae bacterium zg-B36]QQD66229.1 ABC transporter substrate-binding protein [Aerococcaceae bacterium zg-252]NEW63764.1 ABC transporter substrate-binding protein [Facklamia s
MKLRKLSATLLASLTLASAVATSLPVSAQESVVIGGNFELTGGAASYGSVMANALELAVELRNAKGEILDGLTLATEILDNKSDLTESSSVATRLVSNDKIVGIVGPATTGDSQAQIPVITEAKVPAILPAATGDTLTLAEDESVLEYLFRVCFADSYQGTAGASYVYNALGAKKVAILTDQATDYSQGLVDAFTKKYTELGGEIVAQESYQSGDTDFSATLTTLLAQEFDVLYVPGYYTEVGLIIKQAREFGITAPIVGGDGLSSNTLVELAGAANASDVYYTSHFSPKSDNENVQAFLKAYKDKFGTDADTFAALGFDAANLLIDAIERAGSTDREAIKQAIAETKDFVGVTGTFSIDEKHNPVKSVTMIKLNAGEIESAELYSAE